MTADLLDRMRADDPAAGADLTPPEELLARLLADFPEPPVKRARRPRRRIVVAAAAPALAAGVLGLSMAGGGATPGPSLAAQAYAQTSDAFGVLYVRSRVDSEISANHLDGTPFTDKNSTTRESWLYGKRGRVHAVFADAGWSDSVLRADGSIHFTNGYGQDEVYTDADGPDAVAQHENLSKDFVAEFRREYQRGTLDPAGETTFAHKRAQRYVADSNGIAPAVERLHIPGGTWSEHREFFVDAADGTPLGSITTSTTVSGGHTSVVRTTETVQAIEHRAATPENLAQLGG